MFNAVGLIYRLFIIAALLAVFAHAQVGTTAGIDVEQVADDVDEIPELDDLAFEAIRDEVDSNGIRTSVKKLFDGDSLPLSDLFDSLVSNNSARDREALEGLLVKKIKSKARSAKQKKKNFVKKVLNDQLFDLHDCVCSIHGDPHLNTFDHLTKSFANQELGEHLVSESTDAIPDKCKYTLTAVSDRKRKYNEQTPPHIVVARIKFAVMDSDIILSDNMTLKIGDSEIKTSSTVNDDISAVKDNDPDIDDFLKISYPECKISIFFKPRHKSLAVSVDSALYAGKMTGACGDCDGNKENDESFS
ncbi:uncharacterized protein LOC141910864 [Tubulanus polymorphus]|uniref:uncharacterized protein LOC141910864 n=1 Tax=Tubulanus polymorphus TaxID=672921 RepID=UPI003DA562FC